MFLEKIMKLLNPNFEEQLLTAMDKVNNGGDMSDIDTIVDDYYYLIKRLKGKTLQKQKPTVELLDNSQKVKVNGELLDFYGIRHNDSKGTNARMELEVLYDPSHMKEIVEKRLQEKIEKEW